MGGARGVFKQPAHLWCLSVSCARYVTSLGRLFEYQRPQVLASQIPVFVNSVLKLRSPCLPFAVRTTRLAWLSQVGSHRTFFYVSCHVTKPSFQIYVSLAFYKRNRNVYHPYYRYVTIPPYSRKPPRRRRRFISSMSVI